MALIILLIAGVFLLTGCSISSLVSQALHGPDYGSDAPCTVTLSHSSRKGPGAKSAPLPKPGPDPKPALPTVSQAQAQIQTQTQPQTQTQTRAQIQPQTHFDEATSWKQSVDSSIATSDVPRITVSPDQVKALYATGWVAGMPGRLNDLIELIKSTELNAIVIDLKDDTGLLTYASNVALARKIGASYKKVKDIRALVNICRKENIYPIARIVVFKDPVLAKRRPDLAIKDAGGRIWCDRKGIAWVDPNKREVWEYNVQIAKEAAGFGFAEVQFDYVRFPDEASFKALSKQTESSRVGTINSFLKYAKEELSPYRILLSVDVFGLTCSASDDMGIGQRIGEIAKIVDYVSPMVYPSHFTRSSYGLKDPDQRPFETVKKSLTDGLGRIAGARAKMRPWLQDFSLRHEYGEDEVRAQIKASHELGIGTWMLWNPSSKFTSAAVRQKLPGVARVASNTTPATSNITLAASGVTQVAPGVTQIVSKTSPQPASPSQLQSCPSSPTPSSSTSPPPIAPSSAIATSSPAPSSPPSLASPTPSSTEPSLSLSPSSSPYEEGAAGTGGRSKDTPNSELGAPEVSSSESEAQGTSSLDDSATTTPEAPPPGSADTYEQLPD